MRLNMTQNHIRNPPLSSYISNIWTGAELQERLPMSTPAVLANRTLMFNRPNTRIITPAISRPVMQPTSNTVSTPTPEVAYVADMAKSTPVKPTMKLLPTDTTTTPVAAQYSPESLLKEIDGATLVANKDGTYTVSSPWINKTMQKESRGIPSAKNANSTASGLFQFIDSTWKAYGRGNVFNAEDNFNAYKNLVRSNVNRAINAGFTDITPTDLHMMHILGFDGYRVVKQHLLDPKAEKSPKLDTFLKQLYVNSPKLTDKTPTGAYKYWTDYFNE